MWEVIRRVLKRAATSTTATTSTRPSGNLTFVSVYGGDASTVGTYTLDPKTHSVFKREMGVFEYKDGKVTPLAFFGIGGEGYKKARLTRSSGGGEAVRFPPPVLPPSSLTESQVILAANVSAEAFAQLTASGFFAVRRTGLFGVGFALILGVTGRFHFAYSFTYTLRAYMAFTFGIRGRPAVLARFASSGYCRPPPLVSRSSGSCTGPCRASRRDCAARGLRRVARHWHRR